MLSVFTLLLSIHIELVEAFNIVLLKWGRDEGAWHGELRSSVSNGALWPVSLSEIILVITTNM